MRRLLLFICLFLSVAFNSLQAQVFPDLNASTGNENEFVADADSNIYMFFGNRIEKRDKDYYPIWINTYGNLKFKNILLSKTGSLYFIATDSVFYNVLGKVEADGSLGWCKSIPSPSFYMRWNANQLLLDRNDQLIITGTSFSTNEMFFLKIDTIGNIIKQKKLKGLDFYSPRLSHIISDSAGIYTISNWGPFFETYANILIKYDDANDTIIKQSFFQTLTIFGGNGGFWQDGGHIAKSKFQSNASFQATNSPSPLGPPYAVFPNKFNVTKFVGLKPKWQIELIDYSELNRFHSIEEDEFKNTYLSIDIVHTYYPTPLIDKGIIIIDSLGHTDGVIYYPLQEFGLWSSISEISDTTACLTRHYGNQYFYAMGTSNLSQGHINVAKMDSTLDENCTAYNILSITTNTPSSSNASDIKTYGLTLDSLHHKTISVATHSTITALVGNCFTVNVKENSKSSEVTIYPNPVNNTLNIKSDYSIKELTVFDLTGKQVLSIRDQTIIDVSKLNNGLYLIKVKTGQGEFSRKFIKE